jgi:hypothetical protein
MYDNSDRVESSLYTQGIDGGAVLRRRVCQRCDRRGNSKYYKERTKCVTDLQGPPSERTQSDKIRDLKSLAKQYARDRGSCDDTRISYLEYVESEAEADWTLARMIAG